MLFHLISKSDWAQAQQRGFVAKAPEGFVHLSTREQVLGTANRFFKARADVLLLHVDEAGLPVKYEEGEPGVLFPHLYAELKVGSVREATVLRPGDDGVFR